MSEKLVARIKFLEKSNENTSIGWYNINRNKVNLVIDKFHEWQLVDKFDAFQKEVLLGMIMFTRKFGEEQDFSKWQFDILNEIEEHIKFIETLSEKDS